MKKLFVVLLLSALAAGTAAAQSVAMGANIPFDFTIGDEPLAAGSYTVQSLSTSEVLAVRSREGSNAMLILSHGVISPKPQDQTKLVFRQYNGEYFLSQIWMAGDTAGRELTVSNRERELAQTRQPLGVTVLAQRVAGK